MKTIPVTMLAVGLWGVSAFSAEDLKKAVDGSVKKIDSGTKTVVVTTADGTDHTFHYLERTTVHGTEAADKEGKKALHGLAEGSEVAVYHTKRGAVDTADEIDHIGKDGLKASEGTMQSIDRGGKKLTIMAADGSKQTFHLADHAAVDAGKDIEKGSEKSAKVTVYYSEKAGEKVAHFFKKSV